MPTPTHNLEVWCKENGREDLLQEWAHTDKAPHDFTPASHVKVPWKCGECGCGWEAITHNRTRSKDPTGCPACWNRRRGQVVKPKLNFVE